MAFAVIDLNEQNHQNKQIKRADMYEVRQQTFSQLSQQELNRIFGNLAWKMTIIWLLK